MESFVNFIKRVMRVMTHINVGTTLGLADWVLCSGLQLVIGAITLAYPSAMPPGPMGLHANPARTAVPVDITRLRKEHA